MTMNREEVVDFISRALSRATETAYAAADADVAALKQATRREHERLRDYH